MQRTRSREHGFSIIEVLIAVVVLGVTGAALMNGLRTHLVQAGGDQDRAAATVSLAAAVAAVQRTAYVSCADDATPYEPSADGLTVTVREFVSYDAQPWQACSDVRAAGSAQQVTIRNAGGAVRTVLRFASGTGGDATPPPPPPTVFAIIAGLDPSGSCAKFRNSTASKPCTVTVTVSGGTPTNWFVDTISFTGGAISNPTPTTPVGGTMPTVFSTYLTDGGKSCPSGTIVPLTITARTSIAGELATTAVQLTC